MTSGKGVNTYIDTSSLPKITLPQIIAAVFASVGPIAVIVGADLTPDTAHAIDNLRDIGLGLFGADAIVRVGRSVGLGRDLLR